MPNRRSAPSMAEVAPDAAGQTLTVASFEGHTLVGILEDNGSEDVAVLCHGFRFVPYIRREMMR